MSAASRERGAEAVSTAPRQIRLSALTGVNPPAALFCLAKAGSLLVPLPILAKAVASYRYDNLVGIHWTVALCEVTYPVVSGILIVCLSWLASLNATVIYGSR